MSISPWRSLVLSSPSSSYPLKNNTSDFRRRSAAMEAHSKVESGGRCRRLALVWLAGVFVVLGSQAQTASYTSGMSNFGSLNVGVAGSETLTFTFSAGGTIEEPAVLTQGAPGMDFTDAGTGTCTSNGTSYTYGANATCTVVVNFTPKYVGQRLGAVELLNSSGSVIVTSYVSGIGVGPQMTFSPPMVSSFGTNLNQPFGIAFDGRGNLFEADYGSGDIKEFTASSSYATNSNIATGINGAAGMAVDGAGNLFFSNYLGAKVYEAKLTGGIYAAPISIGTGFSGPFGTALDASGNVFVADRAGAVYEITAAGGYTTTTPLGGSFSFSNPYGIALDISGNIYVANGGGELVEILKSGAYATASVLATITGLRSIAVDAGGNVYAAVRSSTAGGIYEILAADGSITSSSAAEMLVGDNTFGPEIVALDSSENVYYGTSSGADITELELAAAPAFSFAGAMVGAISGDSPKTLTITNSGTASLTFPLPLSGTNPSLSVGFTIGNTSTCPQLTISSFESGTLAAGSSCTDLISFAPVAAGNISGSLITTDSNLNLTPGAQSVMLAGTATAATGTAPQTITFPPPPSQVAFGASPVTLTATASSGLGVYYTVTGPATVSGSVLTFTGVGTVIVTANQNGNGTYAAASAVSNSIDSIVPSTVVETTSATLTATMQFASPVTLNSTLATAIQVVTQGATGQDFNYVSGGTCAPGATYTSVQTCTVNYTFTPTHPWMRYGGIKLVNSAGVVVSNIYLNGAGMGPQVTFALSTALPITLGGGFYQPTGAAVDAAGNVYVADLNNGTVTKMPAGCHSSSCVSTLGGGFSGPNTLAVDGTGNIYVADSNNYKVTVMPAGCASSACVTTLGGGFTRAAGIAVDRKGNVYVADYNNKAVTEMPPGCHSVTCLTTLGGGFGDPRGVAVDATGNVYVVDSAAPAVKEMPPGCASISCVTTLGGGLNSPTGIAVDGGGNVYVADASSLVKKIPPGCLTSSCVVTLAGSFNTPGGMAVDGSGNVYFADQVHNAVKELDVQDAPSLSFAATNLGSSSAQQVVTVGNNGSLPLTISTLATDNASLAGAGTTCTATTTLGTGTTCGLGIEFTPAAAGLIAGSASITDNNLNVNPNVTQTIAVGGMGLGQGSMPQTITFPQPTGTSPLTLSATATSGLPVYYIAIGPATISGSTLTVTGTDTVVVTAYQDGDPTYAPATPVSIVVPTAPVVNVGTTSGILTATMQFTSSITLNSTLATAIQVVTQGATGQDFNYVGGGTCVAGASYTSAQTCTVNYSFTPTHPWMRYGGVKLLNSAGVVVSNTYIDGVGNGPQVTFALNTPAVPATLGGGFYQATGVAVDAAGNVYVADLNSGVVSEMPAGCVSSTCVTPLGVGGFSGPNTVAVDGSGNVYVADSNTFKVTQMPAGCASSSCVTSLGSGFFTRPAGIAVDRGGNVYVADYATHEVSEMPPGCLSISCVTTLGGGFSAPRGVAVDALGNVYVADTSTSFVKEMPAGCTSSSCITTLGGGLNSPVGIAVDGGGNVYVSDTANVVKQIPPGCVSSNCVISLGSGFNLPQGVAVDGSGSIYVADQLNSAIKRIDVQDAPSLIFATTAVGSSSAQKVVTLGNNGNQPLTISALTEINASLAGPGTTCSTSATLLAGASCGLGIEFAPTTVGNPLAGSASITDNNLNSSLDGTQTINLTGTGTQQTPTLTLAAVTTVSYGSSSALSAMLAWTGGSPAPTGAVKFSVDNGAPLAPSCTGSTSPITCTYAASFAIGTHTLNASYASDTNYTGASATAESFTVIAATSKLVFGTLPATPLTAGGNGGSAITVLEENSSSAVVTTATDPITVTVTGPAGFTTKTYGPADAIAGVASFNPSAAALTVPGTYTYTATFGSLTHAVATETVNPAVSATTMIPNSTLAANHAVQAFMPVTGAGGTGTLTYSVLPVLPAGLSMASGGAISGTAAAASPLTSYTVTVTDSNSATATATFRLTVNGPLAAATVVATSNLTVNQASAAFIPVVGSGGFGSLSYSVSPVLPAGLSFVSSTGTITGTPTVTSATTTYTVTVTDGNNTTSAGTFSLTVSAETPIITFAVPNHIYGDAAFSVSASSDSTGAFIYSVSGPATISGSTVTLTGAGVVTLQASEAADANDNAATKSAIFAVSTAVLAIRANDAIRPYGSANPVFTGSVSGGLPADSFVESFAVSATTLSPVATYPIVPTVTGANLSSYTENVVNGTLTIRQAPTSIILSASSASSASGQNVTFTVQVLPSASGTPTGLVTVLDNGGPLTTVALTGGSATYTTTALSPGITHVLTATYAGDSNFLGTTASAATAGTTTVIVSGPGTALTVTPGVSFTVIPGDEVNFELLLTPQPGAYPGPVTFTMTGLPPGATATFTPASLNAVTSPTTVQVAVQTAAPTAKLIPMRTDAEAIALSLILLPIGCARRTRKRLSQVSLFAALFIGVLFTMVFTGCGSNGFFSQKPQNYTLTITATSGPVQHVATVTLKIQ